MIYRRFSFSHEIFCIFCLHSKNCYFEFQSLKESNDFHFKKSFEWLEEKKRKICSLLVQGKSKAQSENEIADYVSHYHNLAFDSIAFSLSINITLNVSKRWHKVAKLTQNTEVLLTLYKLFVTVSSLAPHPHANTHQLKCDC